MGDKMTNQAVGERIGLTYSAVSRLRSGQRLPSLKVMAAIADQFNWSMVDQINVRTTQGADGYAAEFNTRLQSSPS